MSALEMLQNYSARKHFQNQIKDEKPEVVSTISSLFDVTTPEGAFFAQVHKNGFAMYEVVYNLKEEYKLDTQTLESAPEEDLKEYEDSMKLTEAKYNWLSDDDKTHYEKSIEYTELYNALKVSGNQEIVATAGSGKTTMMIFKIQHDIVTGEATHLQTVPTGAQVRVVNKMWVCTFLRSGAEELEERLTYWQRKLGYSQTANQISFSTLDAEFKRCLNAMGVETNIADSSKLFSILKKSIDRLGITRNGYTLNKEDYQIISGILTYYRGRLDQKKYQHPNMKGYDLTPTILDAIATDFALGRKAEGVVDFDEITELLYKFLYVTPNKAVQDFVSSRYNFIYIDEFQDTSQMQYAILKFYARGKLWLNRDGQEHLDDVLYTGEETIGKIVAIGDQSQCIYSFKGSDSKIMTVDFDNDFRPCQSVLSYNRRCPSNILNPVIPSIHLNKDSANQQIQSSRDGGIFNVFAFPSYQAMIKQLKTDIERDILASQSVAVLCRTNFNGIIPALALEATGKFNFSISGENMTMNSPLPKKIIACSSLFTERSSKSVENTLLMLVRRGAEYQVKELVKTLKNNSKSIWQVPREDLKYSVPDLIEVYDLILTVVDMKNPKHDKVDEVNGLKALLGYLMVNTFGGDSAYCESARAFIEALLFIIDNNNFQSVYDFIEEVDFLNTKLRGKIKKNKVAIQIATVHEFKGKEADSVYVWDDSEGVYPSNKCDLGNEDLVAEERRVHYIACTRARQRETIYCNQRKIGMFVKEMDCTVTYPTQPSVSI